MRKSWMRLWMLMIGIFAIVDDGGAGGGDDLDFIIDDPAPEPKKEEVKAPEVKEPPKLSGGLSEEEKSELEELKKFRDDLSNERAVYEANAALTKEYPDFDIAKITSKLKEIAKTDPDKASALNNPTGWENLHLRHFAKREEGGDPFDPGRKGADEPFDFDATQKAALGGDKRSLNKLFENAR